jgi:hypothetical protein
VFKSLPYAPVSSEVNHTSFTPSFTTAFTLFIIDYDVYDRSFPRANTVLQYVQAPKQPALIAILHKKINTSQYLYFS